jgi:hypothetical protein
VIKIRARAQAPERLILTVANTAGDPEPLDFTTVTAVVLLVQRPNGARDTWAVTIQGQTSGLLTLERVWSLPDLETQGRYTVEVQMTVPSGIRRAGPLTIDAIP